MEPVSAVTDAWEPFFTAQSAAAAALAGLVFVGLSLNLQRILTLPSISTRAALALVLLVIILVVSSLMLIPRAPISVIGLITLALGLGVGIIGTVTLWTSRSVGKEQPAAQFMANLLLFECAVWPYVFGGVLLMVGNLSALYWIAGAIILSFIKALVDAWVLLVEINR